MKKLALFLPILLPILLTGCKFKLVRDTAPASIDVGWKRVETIVCDSWEVGENGCALKNGLLEGALKIYSVLEGNVSIIAQGCGVDKTFRYDSKPEWIVLPLKDLVGPLHQTDGRITEDCVLTIYQMPDFPGQDEARFPIEGIYGTVTLGVCPEGVECKLSGEQWRLGWPDRPWQLDEPKSGHYTLRGCGHEIAPPTAYNAPLILDLLKLWPMGYPTEGKTGCLFILGVKNGSTRLKHYRKVSLFKEETMKLSLPIIETDGSKINFKGDKAVSLTLVQGQRIEGAEGSFKPTSGGDVLRFYTVQGRSLVAFIKDGRIVWTK